MVRNASDCLQDVPATLARYRFRTLTKTTANSELFPRDERSKIMSRPERVTIWHVHSVFDFSLVDRSDLNVFVNNDVAELVHYRQINANKSNCFNSTQLIRFKDNIIKRLQIGINVCLQ